MTSKYSLERISAIVLFITIVLASFFFIPSASFSLDLSKTILLVTGVFVSFSLYLISAVKSGQITLPYTKVLWAALLLPLSFYISAILSANPHISLFGYSLEVGTWAFITLGFVVMFLSAVLLRTRERVFYSYLGFLGAFVIVALVALGKFFLGPSALTFGGALSGSVASPVGTLSDLAAFFGVAAILSAMALDDLPAGKRVKWLLALALVVSLFALSIVGTSAVWIGLLVFSFIYFLYVFSRGASVEGALRSETERRVSLAGLAVLLVSLLFVWNPSFSVSGARLSDTLAQRFNAANLSVSPSLSATYQVSRPVLKSDPIFGSGPNTFDIDWNMYRPSAINTTIFWNAPFSYGIGLLSTFVATTGIVGALLWLIFLVFYTLLGVRAVFTRGGDAVTRFLVSSSFVISLFLWIVSIFYVPSKAVFIMAFVFSGLFLSSARLVGAVGERTVVFRNSQKLAFVAVLLLVAVLVGNIAYAYSVVRGSVAAYDFGHASLAAASGDIAGARDSALRAANLTSADIYYSAVAQIGVARSNAILTSSTTDATAARQNFQSALQETIAAAQAAVQARPESYQNWIALGELYESLVPAPLSVPGAYDSAKSAYDSAKLHNPESPEPYYLEARLEVENKNTSAARADITQALEKKNDYADAYYLLTQIEIADGNIDAAIKNAQTLTLLDPTNSGIFFQLGLLEYNKGDWQAAEQAFSQALQITPDYANAKYYEGLTLYKLGQADAALAIFQALQEANPDNADLPKIIANIGAKKDPLAGVGTSATTPPISGTESKTAPSHK